MNPVNLHSKLNDFQSMSKMDALKWIKDIIHQTGYTLSDDMLLDLHYLDLCIHEKSSVFEARKKAFLIHKKARDAKDQNDVYMYRAIAHAIATYHVKEHSLKSLYYLNKIR